ncbi:MAG TPA: chemotaxis protein CheX [Spirochaetota bacterium]|nr:chemotaxis protein CheX [Spirochaetota bacterium]HOM39007.1 chemotaxis protein CheX [Spirochaetota bacterium]HPQ49947.1 chemotaxis protein CheX [Spirochaetota bacterium]
MEYVKPFIISAIDIIKKSANIEVKKDKVYMKRGKKSTGGVGIIIDINGDITGKVVYEFSRYVTMRISASMIKESKLTVISKDEYKALLESAILELGNMIAGSAISYISRLGYNCNISTPRFFLGKDVDLIPFYFTAVVIDFTSDYGNFSINLSIKDKRL